MVALVSDASGASLLLWLGCSKPWARASPDRGGVVRKGRSSNTVSPVQSSWEEFLLDLLPFRVFLIK